MNFIISTIFMLLVILNYKDTTNPYIFFITIILIIIMYEVKKINKKK